MKWKHKDAYSKGNYKYRDSLKIDPINNSLTRTIMAICTAKHRLHLWMMVHYQEFSRRQNSSSNMLHKLDVVWIPRVTSGQTIFRWSKLPRRDLHIVLSSPELNQCFLQATKIFKITQACIIHLMIFQEEAIIILPNRKPW